MGGGSFDVHTFANQNNQNENQTCIGGTTYTIQDCQQCQAWEIAPFTCFGKTLGIRICMKCCWGVPVWSVVAFRCCTCMEEEGQVIFCGLNMVPSVNLLIQLPKEEGAEQELFVWGNKCPMVKETQEQTTTTTTPQTQSMDK